MLQSSVGVGGPGVMCILAKLFFSSPAIQKVKCGGHVQALCELDKRSADEIMCQFTPFEVGPGLEGLSICGDHIEVLTTKNVRKLHRQSELPNDHQPIQKGAGLKRKRSQAW